MPESLSFPDEYKTLVYQDNSIVPEITDGSPSKNTLYIKLQYKKATFSELLFGQVPDFDDIQASTLVRTFKIDRPRGRNSWFILSEALSSIEIPISSQSNIIHEISLKAQDAFTKAVHSNDQIGLVVNIVCVQYERHFGDSDDSDAYDDEQEPMNQIFYASSQDYEVHFVPARKTAVENLDTMWAEGSDESCVICLGTIAREVEVIRMPCSHLFHSTCICRWLSTSHVCPTCRFELPTDG